METGMILAGCAIIAGVVFLLIKQYETRLVLLGAGLLMCILAGAAIVAPALRRSILLK